MDAIKISNILHHNTVQSKIPLYFTDKSTPLISYGYTKLVASRIFNYKKVLQHFSIDDLKSKPPGTSLLVTSMLLQMISYDSCYLKVLNAKQWAKREKIKVDVISE